jgi:uncharacterized phiE125 gp8 family phage protein
MKVLTRVTQPDVEPVEIEDVEAWIPVTEGSDDGVLTALIARAREELEDHLGRCFVESEWQLTLDADDLTDLREIRLPRPPLISIDSVTFYDIDGTSTTIDSSTYYWTQTGEIGRLRLKHDEDWPSNPREVSALVIAFTSGYGDTASDIPGAIKTGVLELCTFWYRNRGEGVVFNRFVSPAEASVRSTPPQVKRVLERLSRWRVMEAW